MLEAIDNKLMSRFRMTDMEDVSHVLGMQVTRDRETGTLAKIRQSCARSAPERLGVVLCNPQDTPGCGVEVSLEQPDDCMYATGQLAGVMVKLFEIHKATAKHLLASPAQRVGALSYGRWRGEEWMHGRRGL